MLDVAAVSLVFIAAALVALAWQYRAVRRWNEQVFWASRIAALEADPAARIVMQLLELDGRRVDLFPHEQDYKKRFWVVTHGELAQALRPHTPGERFEEVEARLRDVFDDFFERLERLDELAGRGLVEREELVPYLASWLDAVLDTHVEDPDTEDPALLRYVVHYGFDGTRRLLETREALRGRTRSKLALAPYEPPPRGHRGWRIAREERKAREIRIQQAAQDLDA